MIHTAPGCFIPGFAESTTRWQALLPARWQVITQPGHGIPAAPAYDSWCRETITRLTHIPGNDDIWLGGYSMGGRLALQLLGFLPVELLPRVRLLLISTRSGLCDAKLRAQRRQQDQQWAERIINEGLASFSQWWPQLPALQPVTPWSPEEIKQQAAERQAHDPVALADCLEVCSPGALPDIAPLFASLITRGLRHGVHALIGGAADSAYQQPMQALASELGGQVAWIEHAGHAVHRERPSETQKQLKSISPLG